MLTSGSHIYRFPCCRHGPPPTASCSLESEQIGLPSVFSDWQHPSHGLNTYHYFELPLPGPQPHQGPSLGSWPPPVTTKQISFQAADDSASILKPMPSTLWPNLQDQALAPSFANQSPPIGTSFPNCVSESVDISPAPSHEALSAAWGIFDLTPAFTHQPTVSNTEQFQYPRLAPLTCPRCPSSRFSSKKDLREHINTVHLCTRDWICPACGKSYGTNSNCNRHIRASKDCRESGARPFKLDAPFGSEC
ncbi:hypothetical protein QBC44DRAFT_97902 [Cladorrhinum sp. PSN332]|nr:hypothetical protein QBC44DRAFT_97902 [Cladorrhinum sp. PSN332]